jgi:N-acetylglutamate synthase-like GNAT family acetyltransferase
VNPHNLIIRRATVDDLPALKSIWVSMQLDAETLEPRLTEFQVVERDGEVVGAIGFQILRTAGRLHGEGYSDFSVADTARELFWDRLQKLAASHGVFRLWTQEKSMFWQHWGFSTADEGSLARLPDEWKVSEEKWLTIELKNEAVITAAFATQFAGYSAAEKKSADDVAARAKTITLALTILLLLAFFGCVGFGIWWFMHHRPHP